MIKFIGSVLAIAAFGYLGTFIGWWGLVLVAAIIGFIMQIHGALSFMSGLLGGALFFSLYTYLLDSANEGTLSAMMTEVLKFNPFWPTVGIGALLGALGMLTGKYLRDATLGENKQVRYRGKYK
jgi:hypothetical protein